MAEKYIPKRLPLALRGVGGISREGAHEDDQSPRCKVSLARVAWLERGDPDAKAASAAACPDPKAK
jgi:hypothetical protein